MTWRTQPRALVIMAQEQMVRMLVEHGLMQNRQIRALADEMSTRIVRPGLGSVLS